MNRGTVNRQAANEARLLVPTLATSSKATVEELKERVQSTIRAENQAVAVRSETVAELRRREGTEELVEAVLREKMVFCPAVGPVRRWKPRMNSPSSRRL